MAAETQYTANTGYNVMTAANANLDGTGTLYTVLTAASNGTLIKTVTFKAQVTTTQGMVRLFITAGANTRLLMEVEVPAVTRSGTDPSFEKTIALNYSMQSGDVLKASTQNAETINVIAEGLDWTYYGASIRPESTNYNANTYTNVATTANTGMDYNGTFVILASAGASASGYKGLKVESVTIKALSSTAPGMIRIFIQVGNSTTRRLLTEVPVPATTPSGTVATFKRKLYLNFELQADSLMVASTQNSESFALVSEGVDWKYPA